MTNYETISRYLYSNLSTQLSGMPVYNGIQSLEGNAPYAVFFILDGTPTKYLNNQTAFSTFDVRINLWSPDGYLFDDFQTLIDYFDGKNSIVIDGEDSDQGFIQSVVYIGQSTLSDDGWYGLQLVLQVRS